MALSNGYRMRLMLLGIVGSFVLGCGSASADFVFGEPTNLGPPVNSTGPDTPGSMSADGLSLYLHSNRPGGSGDMDLWVSTRATTDDAWGEPVNLGPTVNSVYVESVPRISEDGLSLYFGSSRPGGEGPFDIWVTTRTTREDPWTTPVNLGPTINSTTVDAGPSISADGLELYFMSSYDRAGGYGRSDIWVTTRRTKDDPWAEPVNLGPTVNTESTDYYPSISRDGLLLLFVSDRPGGYGQDDLWLTMRKTINGPWLEPVNLGPGVNTSGRDVLPLISADGSTLYFGSRDPGGLGGFDILQAPIIPIVDFNGDGKVDGKDVLIMMRYWYDDCAWCDIGPMPWGDGVVNIEDLKVLASYIGEELNDPTLIAHWALDETEGDIAYDSAAVNDAVVFGGAVWQPTGGAVDGALELDGVYDCASTPHVLNPASGPFSIFAWIKGGAPGQVVISQTDSADWLCADSSQGTLATNLMSPIGRTRLPLVSQALITDGQWHRVAFTWDGAYRSLYVDDILVAMDSQPGLADSYGGLNIGCGSDSAIRTFWSGLIDDVCIYNRAVRP